MESYWPLAFNLLNCSGLMVERGRYFGDSRKFLSEPRITFKKTDLNLDLSPVTYSNKDIEKNLVFPEKITPLLAEEIGMHVGDGFLSSKKFEYRLKGSKIDEREFYSNFIAPLYKELFNLNVKITEYAESFGFEVYSKALWTFKNKVLGIPAGPKTRIRVPEVVKVKDTEILTSFIRGYFNTDGSLSFLSKYGYPSYYPLISAASVSELLIKEVAEILEMLGFNPRLSLNDKYWTVQLYGYENFAKYYSLINWSSPKYLDKIARWRESYPKFFDGANCVAWSNKFPESIRACGALDASSNLASRPLFSSTYLPRGATK